MQIKILSIAKKEHDNFEPLIKEYTKLISKFAKVEDTVIFNKKITQAHQEGATAAQRAYSEAFLPYYNKGYNVVLHPEGENLESFDFSKLLSDKMSVNFYIGGAYGFEDSFVKSSHKAVSLSRLTFSHKIAKVVLLEQIYRGFSILNNHPYHK